MDRLLWSPVYFLKVIWFESRVFQISLFAFLKFFLQVPCLQAFMYDLRGPEQLTDSSLYILEYHFGEKDGTVRPYLYHIK